MKSPTSTLTPFRFQNNDVRTTRDENGDVWFVAKDVCDVLGIENSRDAVSLKPKYLSPCGRFFQNDIFYWVKGNFFRELASRQVLFFHLHVIITYLFKLFSRFSNGNYEADFFIRKGVLNCPDSRYQIAISSDQNGRVKAVMMGAQEHFYGNIHIGLFFFEGLVGLFTYPAFFVFNFKFSKYDFNILRSERLNEDFMPRFLLFVPVRVSGKIINFFNNICGCDEAFCKSAVIKPFITTVLIIGYCVVDVESVYEERDASHVPPKKENPHPQGCGADAARTLQRDDGSILSKTPGLSIYFSLDTISALCDGNPVTAKKAVIGLGSPEIRRRTTPFSSAFFYVRNHGMLLLGVPDGEPQGSPVAFDTGLPTCLGRPFLLGSGEGRKSTLYRRSRP